MKTLTCCALVSSLALATIAARPLLEAEAKPMELGAFSVSLAVKDLKASQEFYAKLGFESVMGEAKQNWLILRNDKTTIGLFQGMFEDNIMTFNPGWTWEAKGMKSFEDVRSIQARLTAAGITPVVTADEDGTGPASFVIVDPDGNSILVDQHVPKPER